jgi:hypothetical protein
MAAAFPPLSRMDGEIKCHDRVRVPDGRTGNVVGFYRTRSEMALVRFDDGESRKFVLGELERRERPAGKLQRSGA